MDSNDSNDYGTLRLASDEIEMILKKYGLCGFITLANVTGGIQRFSFREWSGMEWGIGEDGHPFTRVTIMMNPDDVLLCHQQVTYCYQITDYFQSTLLSQSNNMQQVNNDVCTAFNLDRKAIETDCDCKNLN